MGRASSCGRDRSPYLGGYSSGLPLAHVPSSPLPLPVPTAQERSERRRGTVRCSPAPARLAPACVLARAPCLCPFSAFVFRVLGPTSQVSCPVSVSLPRLRAPQPTPMFRGSYSYSGHPKAHVCVQVPCSIPHPMCHVMSWVPCRVPCLSLPRCAPLCPVLCDRLPQPHLLPPRLLPGAWSPDSDFWLLWGCLLLSRVPLTSHPAQSWAHSPRISLRHPQDLPREAAGPSPAGPRSTVRLDVPCTRGGLYLTPR